MTTKTKTTWRKVRLGEVADIYYGKDLPTRKLKSAGFPVYGGNGLIGYSDEYLFKDPKIIVGCRGAYSGNIFKTKPKSFVTHNSLILDFKDKVVYEPFMFYKLLQSNIKSTVTGSAQPQITITELKQLELDLPTEDVQKRIASILSAFDDKIELNNKINQTLEQMAQAIFKEWFIDFRFPGHEKIKMVNSELGKIPEGWETRKAEELLNFEKGIEPGFFAYNTKKKEGFIPFYRVRDLDKQSGVDVYIKKDLANGKLCRENDILLSLDAVIGRVKIGCKGSFSSGIRRVYSKDGFIRNSFIYFWLKSPYIQNTISEYASGTSILHAGQSIKYLKFLFNKHLIEKFQEKAEPIFNKILENINENQKLVALRDLLLPKLISGEVRV